MRALSVATVTIARLSRRLCSELAARAVAVTVAAAAVSAPGCAQEPAAIRLSVTYDASWGLDAMELRSGARAEQLAPTREISLLVGDDAASSPMALELVGFANGELRARGTTTVTPEPGRTVSAQIDLRAAACDSPCEAGDVRCQADGVQTCEADTDGCTGWSAAVACPGDAPFCSLGRCGTTCVDECSESVCDGDVYRDCGQFDGDDCLDLAADQSCESSDPCETGACTADGCKFTALVCDDVPAATCIDSDTLRRYTGESSCVAGGCEYSFEDVACEGGCDNARCDDVSCGGGAWSFEEIADTAALQGAALALVVGQDGAVHVYDGETTRYFRRAPSGEWTDRRLPQFSSTLQDVAIDLGLGGSVHIAVAGADYEHGAFTGAETPVVHRVGRGDLVGFGSVDLDVRLNAVYLVGAGAPQPVFHVGPNPWRPVPGLPSVSPISDISSIAHAVGPANTHVFAINDDEQIVYANPELGVADVVLRADGEPLRAFGRLDILHDAAITAHVTSRDTRSLHHSFRSERREFGEWTTAVLANIGAGPSLHAILGETTTGAVRIALAPGDGTISIATWRPDGAGYDYESVSLGTDDELGFGLAYAIDRANTEHLVFTAESESLPGFRIVYGRRECATAGASLAH